MKTRSRGGRFFHPASGACLLLAALLAAAGCGQRDDAYVLLRRLLTRAEGAPTPLAYAAPDDAGAARVRRLLADGFGAELLRTFAMTKRFVVRTAPPGSVVHARAETPTYVALGVSDTYRERPYRDRVIGGGWMKSAIPADAPLVWINDDPAEMARLPPFSDSDQPLSQTSRDAATMEQIVSGLGKAIVSVVAPGPTDFSTDPQPAYPLRDGYLAFLEVVAAEWRPATGAEGGADLRDPLRQAALFADVRAGDAVFGEPHRRCSMDRSPEMQIRPAQQLVRDPTVIATVLYRLAASSAVGRRLTADGTYLPFVEEPPPGGLSSGLLLGAFRNFQAKLLSAWSRAALAGRTPVDLIDLVSAYADAYPDERAEVTRMFLVTTYGATALPHGIAPQPLDQLASGLATLNADVLFGQRGLRDALRAPPPGDQDL